MHRKNLTPFEAYTAKENAKSQLLSALIIYIAAAKLNDMDDDEQSAELEGVLDEAGKSWDVVSR